MSGPMFPPGLAVPPGLGIKPTGGGSGGAKQSPIRVPAATASASPTAPPAAAAPRPVPVSAALAAAISKAPTHADGTPKSADEIERDIIEARLNALRGSVEGDGPTLEPLNSNATTAAAASDDRPPNALSGEPAASSSSSSSGSAAGAASGAAAKLNSTAAAAAAGSGAPKSSDTLLMSLLCLSGPAIIDSVIEASTEVDGGAHFSVLCLSKPLKDAVTLQPIVSFDEQTIARHHKKMLLATHPDKNRNNPKAQTALAAVTKAFSVLGKEDLRMDYIRKYVELLPVPSTGGGAAGDKSWRPSRGGSGVAEAELEVARRKQLDAHRDLVFKKFEAKIMQKLKPRTTTTKEAAAAAAATAAASADPSTLDASGKRKAPDSFSGFIPAATAGSGSSGTATATAKQQKTSAGSDAKSTSSAASTSTPVAAATAKKVVAVKAAESDSDSDDDRLAAFQAKKRKANSSRLF